MKKIFILSILLIVSILKVNAQCSTSTSFVNQGNGIVELTNHASIPSGWSISYSIDYGDNTYDWGNVIDTNFVHQYYSNDTFIVSINLYANNLLDSSQSCTSSTVDTVVVQDFSCAVKANYISYDPSYAGTTTSSFSAAYHAGTTNVNCSWYIQDTLGNIIYTTSGLDLNYILYMFTQNGTYTISYVAQANDTVLQTHCSDSISIVIHRNVISSCGIPISLQQQNLQGNSVKLTANYTGTFSNRYFLIEGNYFWNTDTITYTFLSGGFHQVGFYGENTTGGVTCRDSICPAIPIGGMPGNCHASFNLWEDSTNVGQWYAFNNSTGFGPPNYLWDFGDGNTSSLAYPTHTYAVPGNYIICLTVSDNYGCSSTMCDSTSGMRISQQQAINSLMGSLTVMAPQVGITENKIIVEGMKLFPNPMLDITTIEFNSTLSSTAKIEIVNILGAAVSSENIAIIKGSNEVKLNTSSLQDGMYIINITSSNGLIARIKALK